MFKIRTLQINDLVSHEDIFKESQLLNIFSTKSLHKLAFLLQPIIPHNLRLVPSIHLAIHKNALLGYVILECNSTLNNSWQINEVFVKDEERNKGIGEELVRYVLSVYGGCGVEHFLTEVDSQNFPALSLFHHCGFRRYAKVCFYEKEINVETLHATPQLDGEFIIRPQTNNDLQEIQKLDLSTIPPDLKPALGRSKDYFKDKKNSVVLIDKSRNLIVGWAYFYKETKDHYFLELLASPGWTHLYENFLNTIICDHLTCESNKFTLSVKVVDYIAELTDILTKSGFLVQEVRELLVRTIWQKVKEKAKKPARAAVPWAAPT